jgi:hypothetical protein
VSNGSSVLHNENRFQSHTKLNQKGVHGKRNYFGEILSHHLKDGELFHGINSRIHRKNKEADELAKDVIMKTMLPSDVFFQTIEDPSIKTFEPEPRMVNII